MVECTVTPHGPWRILRVTHLLGIVVWVVTLEALSLAVWPLVRRALPGAVDGGWAASRLVGELGGGAGDSAARPRLGVMDAGLACRSEYLARTGRHHRVSVFQPRRR